MNIENCIGKHLMDFDDCIDFRCPSGYYVWTLFVSLGLQMPLATPSRRGARTTTCLCVSAPTLAPPAGRFSVYRPHQTQRWQNVLYSLFDLFWNQVGCLFRTLAHPWVTIWRIGTDGCWVADSWLAAGWLAGLQL